MLRKSANTDGKVRHVPVSLPTTIPFLGDFWAEKEFYGGRRDLSGIESMVQGHCKVEEVHLSNFVSRQQQNEDEDLILPGRNLSTFFLRVNAFQTSSVK